jgi:hypothetical protein
VALAAVALAGASALPARAAGPPQIHTVAGGGSCKGTPVAGSAIVGGNLSGGACDNVPATSVQIYKAQAVATLPDGSFLYVDYYNHLVRQVSPGGIVTTVAGNGTTTDAPDGTPAVQSGLNGPISVAPLPAGGFLITEYNGSVVRMVSADPPGAATITTIAGTGSPGGGGALGGPGVAARSVALNHPTDAEPTADGQVLIADHYNDYVRLLSAASPDAAVSTIAGGGGCDDSTTACDGTAAGSVAIHRPTSVAPIQGGSGGYLLSEVDSGAVRRISQVSPAGTFTTVAGIAGHPGFSGDGGPATAAQLDHPTQVVSTADGGFLIADTNNERVRQVSPSGAIATAAGNGVASYAGDGGNAADASLQAPVGVSPRAGGGFLIADGNDNAVRAVTIPPTTTITFSPAAPNGLNGWYTSAVRAKLTSDEPGSINCVLDPGEAPPAFDAFPTPCSFTKSGADITGDGTHVIYAASANKFKDKETPASASVKIDSTPPTLTCARNATFVADTRQVVTAQVSDATSGPRTPIASGFADTSLLGPQRAFVWSSDNAGNSANVFCPYTVVPATFSPSPVVFWKLSPSRRGEAVSRLLVTNVPVGAAVRVTCRGKGCPFRSLGCGGGRCTKRHPTRNGTGTVDLSHPFAGRLLAVGAQLSVSITRHNTTGRIWLITVRGGGHAAWMIRCLDPDSSVPKGCRG